MSRKRPEDPAPNVAEITVPSFKNKRNYSAVEVADLLKAQKFNQYVYQFDVQGELQDQQSVK